MGIMQADHQRMFTWGAGHEGDDGEWEVTETWLSGTIRDNGAITFRVNDLCEDDILWEDDGTFEIHLEPELARHIVSNYESVHGALIASDRERQMQAEIDTLTRERNYWRSVVEDPGLYWGEDNPPYRLYPEDDE